MQRIEDFEKERAAEEDALCDDPDAHFDICQSATLAFADKDKDKDELTQRDVDVLCDASEDYEAHKEQCDKLYDKMQDVTLVFASFDKEEESCEDNDGIWREKNKSCHYAYDEDGDKLNVINGDYEDEDEGDD